MKKKGFTLIELLAVIVVLGIIVLIVAPIFMETVFSARKSGYRENIMGLIRAVGQDSAEHDYTRYLYKVSNGNVTYDGKKIDYNGSISGEGTVKIDLEGNVKVEIDDGRFCGIKPYKSSEPVVEDTGKCPKLNDTTEASVPELLANMYPVIWDATISSWVIADEINYEENGWYDYENKQWANAVTVTPSKREKYRTAKVGQQVEPADIVGHYVWIPRFQYQMMSTSPSLINIKFHTGGKLDENMTVHPAFRFGGREMSGFWVGKFETTGDVDRPTILPNQIPLTAESLNAFFESAQSFRTSSTSKHGFNEKKSDTHMMKNTEWGAVAYLSHSKYGTGKEITANGSGKTGGGNYVSFTSQSTTGNIYGVYDMAGGASEYVMGNNLGNLGNSHMSELPANKYYDYYTSYSASNYDISINGDAIKETKGWYQDSTVMVTNDKPWFIRGGEGNSTSAGIFSFAAGTGAYQNHTGYRLVVVGT